MSWTNPFANTSSGTGLTEEEVQGVIDTLTFSPVYTNQSTAQSNLTSYEIVRVNLASNTISLPVGVDGMHIRIMNTKPEDLDVKDQSGTTMATMYQELVSFYYNTDTWIIFSSY